jgi:hypothetical protein
MEEKDRLEKLIVIARQRLKHPSKERLKIISRTKIMKKIMREKHNLRELI